jgi:hypothetical protein
MRDDASTPSLTMNENYSPFCTVVYLAALSTNGVLIVSDISTRHTFNDGCLIEQEFLIFVDLRVVGSHGVFTTTIIVATTAMGVAIWIDLLKQVTHGCRANVILMVDPVFVLDLLIAIHGTQTAVLHESLID